jgi:hypothetical protein
MATRGSALTVVRCRPRTRLAFSLPLVTATTAKNPISLRAFSMVTGIPFTHKKAPLRTRIGAHTHRHRRHHGGGETPFQSSRRGTDSRALDASSLSGTNAAPCPLVLFPSAHRLRYRIVIVSFPSSTAERRRRGVSPRLNATYCATRPEILCQRCFSSWANLFYRSPSRVARSRGWSDDEWSSGGGAQRKPAKGARALVLKARHARTDPHQSLWPPRVAEHSRYDSTHYALFPRQC